MDSWFSMVGSFFTVGGVLALGYLLLLGLFALVAVFSRTHHKRAYKVFRVLARKKPPPKV